MPQSEKKPLLLPYELKNFETFNLVVESEFLKANPLGDPYIRHNYCLVPKGESKSLPVVFHLSGYFSNGPSNFASKTLNKNFVEKIDEAQSLKKAPRAVHVFVDAMTYWGGSQFLNSAGCGEYEDYIVKELVPQALEQFGCHDKKIAVMGGSSGGYGALHLISIPKSPFQMAFATAPDSFFDGSLWPEVLSAAPEILKFKNLRDLKKKIDQGELQDKKSFFNLANAVAMAHCYSHKDNISKNKIDWPIDLYSGELKPKIWKHWKKHDPIVFLKKRLKNIEAKEIHLDVGLYDNFHLQYGTRQIYSLLKQDKKNVKLTEFSGNHFGLSARKLVFLETLAKRWS